MLGKDFETKNKTTAVAMQQRDKHASTAIEIWFETVFMQLVARQLQ
jgi:hypothetical protein